MTARTTYVVHDERRWRVVGEDFADGRQLYELELRTPRGKTTRLWAWANDCKPWKRPEGHRVIVGLKDFHGAPIVMDIQQDDRGETLIKLRQKGRSRAFRTTLEGLYQMAARAEAQRVALERAHRRRTRGRG
jgi:hypothetical protein